MRVVQLAGILLALVISPQTANAQRKGGAKEPGKGTPSVVIPANIQAMHDLEYGKAGDVSLKLDLYVPRDGNGPHPLILWIHGGGWQSGNKAQFRPAQMLQELDGRFAVASVEYRLTGVAPFPAQIQDCKAAVRWLRANASKYKLDPERFVAWGSSAGGHLVALLGTSGGVKEFEVGKHLDVSSRVRAVIDYYGPTDLIAMVQTPGYTSHANAASPESKLLGGSPPTVPQIAAAANPLTHIDPEDPPFFIVHGDSDPVVPQGQSKMLHEALGKAGVASHLKILAGARHGGPEFTAPQLLTEIDAFLSGSLFGGTSPAAVPAIASPNKRVDRSPAGGILYYAKRGYENNTASIANPNVLGGWMQFYWSQIEKADGRYDWSEIDARMKPWIDAGKKVALRVYWIGSGGWGDPHAGNATPQFVLDKGAQSIRFDKNDTTIPLPWDPICKQYAFRFMKEIARKFDRDPNVLFIDITPGAETNPYRYLMINRMDPDFKNRYAQVKSSDGLAYSDDLWQKTVRQWIDAADEAFTDLPLLVTLNVGSLNLSQRKDYAVEIGQYCVDRGFYVGQNGLGGGSYQTDSPRLDAFRKWSQTSRVFFETLGDAGSISPGSRKSLGTFMEIVQAAERANASYLLPYPRDVLRATRGQSEYGDDFERALIRGARTLDRTRPAAEHPVSASSPGPVAAAPASKATVAPGKSGEFKIEGEKWTMQAEGGPVNGILVKPPGKGLFPAILISHGLGSNGAQFGGLKAREMAKWGMVCIAPDYTHSSPQGDRATFGASPENLRRARVCLDILKSMPEVDSKRIVAYGNSMGAFLTVGLAAESGDRLAAAAITAGGVALGAAAESNAAKIKIPMLILHGSTDTTVPPSRSQQLLTVLRNNKTPCDRRVFEGIGHNLHQEKAGEVYPLLREWFTRFKVLSPR